MQKESEQIKETSSETEKPKSVAFFLPPGWLCSDAAALSTYNQVLFLVDSHLYWFLTSMRGTFEFPTREFIPFKTSKSANSASSKRLKTSNCAAGATITCDTEDLSKESKSLPYKNTGEPQGMLLTISTQIAKFQVPILRQTCLRSQHQNILSVVEYLQLHNQQSYQYRLKREESSLDHN
ncbi:hypothetical protein ACFX15_028276 [Malus domestica]